MSLMSRAKTCSACNEELPKYALDRYTEDLCGEACASRKSLADALGAIERLKAEILEARNEAATVRRAYLHERSRAERAIGYLRSAADGIEAAAYVEHDARKP